MNNGRPQNIPTCEHGFNMSQNCSECRQRDKDIRAAVTPLIDEYWDGRGKNDLDHLFYRAYRKGLDSGKSQ